MRSLRAGSGVIGWVVLLSIGAALPAKGQPRYDLEALRFSRYDAAEGLSHNTVSSPPLVDRRGFLWVGTIDGLNRYDGRAYVVYRHDDRDPRSISDGFIHALVEDADGALWVGTRDGGLNRYDWQTERFTTFRHVPGDPQSLPGDFVKAMLYDAGRLWVVTYNNGFGIFDRATGRFRRAELAVEGRPGAIPPDVSLYRRGDGDLWVGTEGGLFRVAADALEGVPAEVAPGAASLVLPARPVALAGTPHVIALLDADDGRIWVGTRQHGLFVLDREGRVVEHGFGSAALTRGYVTSLMEAEGRVWVGTQSGLYLVDPTTQRTVRYHHRRDDPASLSHDNITHLYRDGGGTIWISTWGGGFNRVQPASPFVLVQADPDHPGAHLPGFILSLYEDPSGDVLVGTAVGLHRFGPGPGTRQVIAPAPAHPAGLIPGAIWAIREGRSALWVGTETGGLYVAPKAALQDANARAAPFRPVRRAGDDPDGPGDDNVRAVLEDRQGRLWAGYNERGLDLVLDPAPLVDGGAARFIHLRHDSSDAESLSDDGIRSLFQDRDGDVWVGTSRGGACRVRLEGGPPESPLRVAFTCLRYDPADPNSLSHNNVQSIYQDTSGTYWFATLGGGLVSWDRRANTFTRYGRAEGLPNETVYGILDDGNGHFWLPTDNGLARFTLADRTFRTYTQRDGLQYNEFNSGAYHRGRSGRLYVGGPNGFNYFEPEELDQSAVPPPVYLTGFRVFDAPRRFDRSLAALDEVVLSHRENFVTFEYAAPAFDDPGRVRYTYLLEGVDPEPVRAGDRRSAGYTGLHPGRYVFRVWAFHADAPSKTSVAAIRLVVTPPWWATWWFYTLAGAAGLAAFVAGVRYVSTRKLKARVRALELEHRLQRERERISHDLHDHVGAHLTGLVSGLDLMGRYDAVDDRARRAELLAALRAETRQTMAQLRGTIWALNQQAVSAEAFAEQLGRYAADRGRFVGDCQIVVSRSGAGDTVLTPVQALHLFRIVQEAVQNAVKHAGARTITIALDAAPGRLTLRVHDDGTFKPPGPDHPPGYGLAGMCKRAAEIGADFDLQTRDGTTVTVTLAGAGRSKDDVRGAK